MGQRGCRGAANDAEAMPAPAVAAQGQARVAKNEPSASSSAQNTVGELASNLETPKRAKVITNVQDMSSPPRVHRAKPMQIGLATPPVYAKKALPAASQTADVASAIASAAGTAGAARQNIKQLGVYLERRRADASAAAAVADAIVAAGAARRKTADLGDYLEARRAEAEFHRLVCQEMAEQASIDSAQVVVRQLHWSVERAAVFEDDTQEEAEEVVIAEVSEIASPSEHALQQPIEAPEDSWGDTEEPVSWDRRCQSSPLRHGLSGIMAVLSPKRARSGALAVAEDSSKRSAGPLKDLAADAAEVDSLSIDSADALGKRRRMSQSL